MTPFAPGANPMHQRDTDNAKAQLNLDVMYYRGQGMEQSDVEAAKCFRKAAKQGVSEAQFNLAISIMMLIARFFYYFRENPIMDKVFIRVRPAVAAIMAMAVYKLAKKSKFKYFQYFVILAVVIGIEYFRINPAFFILAGIVFSVILSFKRKEG